MRRELTDISEEEILHFLGKTILMNRRDQC